MPQCCVSAAEWCLIQLTCVHDPEERFSSFACPFKRLSLPALHLTRFECGKHARTHPPHCITIPIQDKFQTLEAELRTIIDDHRNYLTNSCLNSWQRCALEEGLKLRMMVGHKIIFVYIFVDIYVRLSKLQ
jgi:hypothetical protein